VRAIFYVSDGTGITAETIGHSVLTQFEGVEFESRRIPFVTDAEKARAAVARIQAAWSGTGQRPVVVTTVVDPVVTEALAESGALILDAFAPFIAPLEAEFATRRQPRVGKAHGLADRDAYDTRIAATNYAMAHDDGVDPEYTDAEVILLGVSRSGKTPTCLYMALQFGVRAANCPLTEDELQVGRLSERLLRRRDHLFALTIDPVRLQQIREARRPGSRYASLAQCRWEVAEAEKMYRRDTIPVVSTTHTSIEEIAGKVMTTLGIQREMF
jgi:hypothetical protein